MKSNETTQITLSERYENEKKYKKDIACKFLSPVKSIFGTGPDHPIESKKYFLEKMGQVYDSITNNPIAKNKKIYFSKFYHHLTIKCEGYESKHSFVTRIRRSNKLKQQTKQRNEIYKMIEKVRFDKELFDKVNDFISEETKKSTKPE